ncbi:MAG: hypothetical protein VB144_11565 [Clostridia bacterium]|nr:hypothetical protein [Clostridia bacterium]
MTLFKVWGWIHFAAAIITALSLFIRAFIGDDGVSRAAAGLVFLMACASVWWVWTALRMAV